MCVSYIGGPCPCLTYALRDARSQRCSCFYPLGLTAIFGYVTRYTCFEYTMIEGQCNQIPLHSAVLSRAPELPQPLARPCDVVFI